MLKSENARLSGWVYVDLHGRDLVSAVREMQAAVAREVRLTPGYSLAWSGQFEYFERAKARLGVVVPFTLVIILVLLYLIFRRVGEALLVMATLPFALVGGIWLMWLLGHSVSIAGAVGFIALAGVSAEFGVVMLIYLKHAYEDRGPAPDAAQVETAVREGALLRVRPKAMTVAVILAGLLPILLGSGAGSEVMSRIAAPMVGGMISSTVLTLAVIPAIYALVKQWRLRRGMEG